MSVVEPVVAHLVPQPISPLREAWTAYRRNSAAVVGSLLLLVIVAFVLYGTFVTKAIPMRSSGRRKRRPVPNSPCHSAPTVSAAISCAGC